MAARRAQAARASHLASSSNLAASASPTVRANNASRLKATSMTNLQASSAQQSTNSLKRPASRNALDNIHKGMNAKFTHVQSKVLLQNIRPHGGVAGSKIPANNRANSPSAARPGGASGATLPRLTPTTPSSTTAARRAGGASTPTRAAAGPAQSDRSQLINRIKTLQEEAADLGRERDDLKQELERERADRTEQVAAAKGELEAKALEAERQSEEYHQKLIEAYELADQNRRAADNVLSESRQREEELRKKIDELEGQLAELREFVAMKEEMMGKMGELREQIRVERERYDEKTRNLHQMFENEKISGHQVDQNSNYFRRQKPSLQSVESIDRLAADAHETMAGSSGNQERQQQEQNAHKTSKNRKHDHHHDHEHHQSAHDIYGSKLSTRMQDGARAAWKKSRKFASSVITGGLGGLSACRKHNISGKRGSSQSAASADQLPARTMLHVHALPQEGHQFGPCQVVVASSSGGTNEPAGEQHTSVVEVGATVGEFMSTHAQQQVVTQAPSSITNGEQQQQYLPVSHHEHQPQQAVAETSGIRVDENNKLTIVTKFNELAVEPTGEVAPTGSALSGAPSSHSEQGSERSRCESSSSGRGTSDCGSPAGSQNGDRDDQQQQRHRHFTQKTHERKSSLFKASGVFGGEQVDGDDHDEQTGGLNNKTLKSFFAHAANSTATAKARQQQQQQQQQGQNNDSEISIQTRIDQANEFVRYEGQQRQNQGSELEMELMEKVKQVSESYELHKLKTQNRTIELDARLSSERLFAAKLRLHQASGENEKLSKQLRSCQAQMREQEKKLMLAETMLRQLVDGHQHASRADGSMAMAAAQPANYRRHRPTGLRSPRAGKLPSTTKTTSGASGSGINKLLPAGARPPPPLDQNRFLVRFEGGRDLMRRADSSRPLETTAAVGRESVAQTANIDGGQSGALLAQLDDAVVEQQVEAAAESSSHQHHSDIATQTSRGAGSRQPAGRARTIINDLRQRLNLVGSGSAAAAAATARAASSPSVVGDAGGSTEWQASQVKVATAADARKMANKVDAAIQADESTGTSRAIEQQDERSQRSDQSLELIERQRSMLEQLEHNLLFGAANESAGERRRTARPRSRPRPAPQPRQDARRRSISLDAFLNQSLVREVAGEQVIISRGWPPSAIRRRRTRAGRHPTRPHSSQGGVSARDTKHTGAVAHQRSRNGKRLVTQLRPTVAVRGPAASGRRRSISVASSPAAATLGALQKRRLLIEFLNCESAKNNGASVRRLSAISGNGGARRSGSPRRHLTNVVQYELAVHDPSGQLPIVLRDGRS